MIYFVFRLKFYPRLTRTHTVSTGRKNAHTSSKALQIHKVFPAAFSSSGRLSATAKLLAPDSNGFSSDFGFLRLRCVVTPRNQIKAQQSGFDLKRKKERAKCSFRRKAETKWRKFLLTMRKARPTSRTPSKAQRSGFVRKKEEGASIVQFSPQGGNGMVRTSLLPCPPSKAQRSGFARKRKKERAKCSFRRKAETEWCELLLTRQACMLLSIEGIF